MGGRHNQVTVSRREAALGRSPMGGLLGAKKWTCGHDTHPLEGLQARPAALGLCVLGEAEVVLGYTVRQVAVRLPTERTPSKNKLVGANSQ